MKTKLVYILISSQNDYYLEQAYISMYSAKYYMPDSYITLLTDKMTTETFIGTRQEEVKYVDELIVVNLNPKFDAKRRSRLLKTSARKHVKGDFLFIDTDTIIVKPLYEIDDLSFDIAACWDTHALFEENPYRKMCLNHGKILDWPIELENIYFNSGIIYAKDTQKVHEFYELWNKNYIEGNEKGVTMDQPSFAKTNYMLNHIVETLDDVWNCELKHGIRFLKEAKIVHYLTTSKSANKTNQFFILNDLNTFNVIKDSAYISDKINNTIQNPFYGIANITHCFAGDDVYFFQTKTFYTIRNLYKTSLFDIIDKFILLISNIYNKIKHSYRCYFKI